MASVSVVRPAPKPGARNSSLTAIRRNGTNRSGVASWEVECGMCGRHVTMTTNQWRCNRSGMCNDCRRRAGMVGKRFGRLTVTRWVGLDAASNQMWECRCRCGRTVTATTTLLKRGKVKSCGCLKKKKDLVGERFGRLTVVGFHGYNGQKAQLWDCVCDCGNHTVEPSSKLTARPGIGVRSCGCDGRRLIPRDDQKLYSKWLVMKRGDHAKRWDRYETFRNWAKSHGYNNRCTLARVDSTQPYSPENCYWLDNRYTGRRYSLPSNWKPMRLYRNGMLFARYPSLTMAANDLAEELPGHKASSVMTALRQLAHGRCSKPYLGVWTARYEEDMSADELDEAC